MKKNQHMWLLNDSRMVAGEEHGQQDRLWLSNYKERKNSLKKGTLMKKVKDILGH